MNRVIGGSSPKVLETRIVLQPAIGGLSPKNIKLSIGKALDLNALPLDPAERSELTRASHGGPVYAWGNTHDKAWRYMRPGDVVLFLTQRGGSIEYVGTVIALAQSEKLAGAIWGDACGDFQYVYFLASVECSSLSRGQVNEIVGYKDNYPWQQPTVIRDVSLVNQLQSLLGSPSQPLPPMDAIASDDFTGLSLEDAQDGLRLATYRKEHQTLKANLFKGQLAMRCAVCGELFPKSLLVTAHLKKRSECAPEERIDPAVVLPMCVAGCDALYERGYLSLDAATSLVVETPRTAQLTGTYMHKVAKGLVGRCCPYELTARAKYLEWHQNS